MTQRGYLTAGLAIALAVASLAAFGLWNRIGAAHKALATSEAQVTLWTDAAQTCSDSAEKAKKAADIAAAAALAALQQARREGLSADTEIARLKAQKPIGTICVAGQAVATVREGLK